ncbi:hypothetical protein D3C85_1192520 [compost metagenome]
MLEVGGHRVVVGGTECRFILGDQHVTPVQPQQIEPVLSIRGSAVGFPFQIARLIEAEYPAANPDPADGDRALDIALLHIAHPVAQPERVLPCQQQEGRVLLAVNRPRVERRGAAPGHVLRLEQAAGLLVGGDGGQPHRLPRHGVICQVKAGLPLGRRQLSIIERHMSHLRQGWE